MAPTLNGKLRGINAYDGKGKENDAGRKVTRQEIPEWGCTYFLDRNFHKLLPKRGVNRVEVGRVLGNGNVNTATSVGRLDRLHHGRKFQEEKRNSDLPTEVEIQRFL